MSTNEDHFLHEEENFLCDNFCNYLIDLFKKNVDKSEVHGLTTLIGISELDYMNLDPIKKLYAMIANHCLTNLDKNGFINYFQVVEWKVGSYQLQHLDFKEHLYTSVIYLNQNFEGGETVLLNQKITPKTGKIISFKGSIDIHEVLPIKSGIRYTVPVWYKVGNF